MPNHSKIKIIDNSTQDVLFEFSISASDEAYQKATQLEQMGLDIFLDIPSVTESLCESLGVKGEREAKYKRSVISEIEDHE